MALSGDLEVTPKTQNPKTPININKDYEAFKFKFK